MGDKRMTRRQALTGLFSALAVAATQLPLLGAIWRRSVPGRDRVRRGRPARVSPAPHTVTRHG